MSNHCRDILPDLVEEASDPPAIPVVPSSGHTHAYGSRLLTKRGNFLKKFPEVDVIQQPDIPRPEFRPPQNPAVFLHTDRDCTRPTSFNSKVLNRIHEWG
jgi:hypothetical protein